MKQLCKRNLQDLIRQDTPGLVEDSTQAWRRAPVVVIGVLKYGYRAHTHGAGQVHWAAIASYKEIAIRNHSGKIPR